MIPEIGVGLLQKLTNFADEHIPTNIGTHIPTTSNYLVLAAIVNLIFPEIGRSITAARLRKAIALFMRFLLVWAAYNIVWLPSVCVVRVALLNNAGSKVMAEWLPFSAILVSVILFIASLCITTFKRKIRVSKRAALRKKKQSVNMLKVRTALNVDINV